MVIDMNKKRALICAVVCLIAVLAFTLASCDREPAVPDVPPIDPDVPGNVPGAEVTGYLFSFEDSAGVSIESDKTPGERVQAGQTVTFTLKVSVYYEGTPTVYAGEDVLTPDADGRYSVTVEGNTSISVKGLTLKSSSMSGGGDSIDDPFLITEAIDLIYIAEQVNLGNTAYVYGFYSLQNDIDCMGEKLEIIGNGEMDQAVFAGYFNGNGHTVSNYRIETDSSRYVGLFGILQADTVSSQGGTVNNLKLKDFTMSVSSAGISCFCGSFVGYGMGGNLMLCSAENGRIELYADYNSFAYVGGLMGIQQALDFNSLAYYSSVSYCSADVDVTCRSGSVYAAGGVVGYLSASDQLVTASVNNSYSTGSVRGALRTGGVVGHLASGTSVVNCYATGGVSAQSFATDLINSESFCYAYAGGVVGYSELDCVISECFSASVLGAKASIGSRYGIVGGVLAGSEQPGEYDFGSHPVTVHNCVYAEGGADGDIILTGGGYLKSVLNWKVQDWVFADGAYPTVNPADAEDFTFTVSFRFGEVADMNAEPDLEVSGFDVYMPLAYWYSIGEDGIPSRLLGEDGDSRISYGYFFDPEYTLPVPESFIPTRDITLYAAVADVSEVAGEYILQVSGDGERLVLILDGDGMTVNYSDAGKLSSASYIYDGNKIVLKNLRLARYSSAVGTGMDRYSLYDFCAVPDNGRLIICGGVYEDDDDEEKVYFTSAAPLVAVSSSISLSGTYTDGEALYTFRADGTGAYRLGADTEDITYTLANGVLKVKTASGELWGTVSGDKLTLDGKDLSVRDAFCGSWSVGSGANKVYTFDGAGNWSYSYYGYRLSGASYSRVFYERLFGSYTVDGDGVAHISGGLSGTASFDDGALNVDIGGRKTVCYRDGCYIGVWIYEDYGLTLTLDGIGKDGIGSAHIAYEYSNGIIEKYELNYAFDELDADTVCLYYEGSVFGYASYLPARGTLNATVYVGPLSSFMQNVDLKYRDEYVGDWVGELDGFPQISFDGCGGYLGELTVNGQSVPYTLDGGTLSGSFAYGGRVYLISYDEASGCISVSGETYRRKDAFGELVLTDGNGVIYSFDGRGELSVGGVMTVSKPDGSFTEYAYRINGDGIDIYGGDGDPIGSIVKDTERNEYVLSIDGDTKGLRIKTKFTGVWGMNGSVTSMTVGSMGLDGTIEGTIKGDDAVTFKQIDDMTLSFVYSETTFYAIFVGEGNVVISSYEEWYLYEDQILCAPADELLGTWTYKLGNMVLAWQFDGMSGSTLTSGTAQTGVMRNGEISSPTSYYYTYADGYYVLWTVDSTGLTRIYRVEFCDPTVKGAYVSKDGTRALKMREGDRLYRMEALDDENGITYSFNGFGDVEASDGSRYEYSVIGEIDYTNGTVSVRLTGDGESFVAVIDFSGSQSYITFDGASVSA